MRKTNMSSLTSHLSIKYQLALLGLAIALIAAPVMLRFQPVWAADSCSTPATNYGTDTTSVTLSGTATYTIWTHMEIPSSSANSILLNINGTCYNVGGGTSIPANTWEWIDYYDGKSANTVGQSLNQGNQNVQFIGTSSGARVDEVELVPGTCTPTGNGNNCVTTTTTGGSSSGGTGSAGGGGSVATVGTSTNNNSGSGYTSGGINGGTLTPTNTSTPTQVTSPFTVQPATSSNSNSDPIVKVQYYLSNKLLATVTTSPFSYRVNTKKILNGTYTLKTNTIYKSGNTSVTSQTIIIKNPASFTQLMLAAEHYIVPEIVTLFILIVGIALIRKRMRSRQQLDGSSGGSTDIGGGSYMPLSYASTSYPTESQPVPFQSPEKPADNPVPASVGDTFVPLSYANSPNPSPLPQTPVQPLTDNMPSGNNKPTQYP
jgi:hypothetical protein